MGTSPNASISQKWESASSEEAKAPRHTKYFLLIWPPWVSTSSMAVVIPSSHRAVLRHAAFGSRSLTRRPKRWSVRWSDMRDDAAPKLVHTALCLDPFAAKFRAEKRERYVLYHRRRERGLVEERNSVQSVARSVGAP